MHIKYSPNLVRSDLHARRPSDVPPADESVPDEAVRHRFIFGIAIIEIKFNRIKTKTDWQH